MHLREERTEEELEAEGREQRGESRGQRAEN
jgi:hypothetical protein